MSVSTSLHKCIQAKLMPSSAPILMIEGLHKASQQGLVSDCAIQYLSYKRAVCICGDLAFFQESVSVSVKTELRRLKRRAALQTSVQQALDIQRPGGCRIGKRRRLHVALSGSSAADTAGAAATTGSNKAGCVGVVIQV